MRQTILTEAEAFMESYRLANGIGPVWKKPLFKYGDARQEGFRELAKVVIDSHFMPEDFLPGATTVISYYVPFSEALAAENIDGAEVAPSWAKAYLDTNAMAAELNKRLVSVVAGLGFNAAAPTNIGMLVDTLNSRWSQRHVARLAGHGTFGLNNMLISDAGCCGRYFSVVTDLPVDPDPVVTGERCLYKARGVCGICAKRCVAGALGESGFDRRKCFDMCMTNDVKYPGADVCGKCDVGLPCSFRIP